MNPACDIAPEELIAFTEEDLPERRMRDLEAHVPGCPICQERLIGARETTNLLQQTMPKPEQHSRHDLLVRLYQEAERQTDHPHRSWTQAASLTAVGATFLIAAAMLWSGIGQFVDYLPQSFQRASPDLSTEWVAEDDEAAAIFENAPLPVSLGDGLPVYDWWVRSGIRVIVYQDHEEGEMVVEVSQFFVNEDSPPGYMTASGEVNGMGIYVDDPDFIREARWTDGDLAHHLQFHAPDTGDRTHLTPDDIEQIVLAFQE